MPRGKQNSEEVSVLCPFLLDALLGIRLVSKESAFVEDMVHSAHAHCAVCRTSIRGGVFCISLVILRTHVPLSLASVCLER